MPAPLPETRENKADSEVQDRATTFDFLPQLPHDITVERTRAVIDMVFGFTEVDAGKRNGLSRDQCARLKAKYRGEIEQMKDAKAHVLKCMVGTAVYSMVELGLQAAAQMSPKTVDTPHKLSALANAAQCFHRLSDLLPDPVDTPAGPRVNDAKQALSDLKGIQHVVVDPQSDVA